MAPSRLLQVIAISMNIALIGFAVALLLARKTERRDQTVLLAAFLGLYGFLKLDDLLGAAGTYEAMPHLAGIIFPFRYLLPAAIFFYARAMTARRPQWLRRSDAWALVWPALLLAGMWRFYFLSATEKEALITWNLDASSVALAAVVMCRVSFVLFLGVVVGYLYKSFRLLLRHTERVRDLFSNIEDKSLEWLRIVLLLLAAGWTWNELGQFLDMWALRPDWHRVVSMFLELGWVAVIAFYGVRQQPVFDPSASQAELADAETGKYARSALCDERMARIASSLDLAMTRDRLYANPNLSLRALSDHLGVSENYLSQTLSLRLGANFFDFVNRHRIAAACRRLETTDETVLNVAHDVGFNSRSTFNAAFKKHAGVTPSQYRDAARICPSPLGAPSTSGG